MTQLKQIVILEEASKSVFTCRDLLDELGSIVATLHQQVGPDGQVLGRIHPEHVGFHALLRASAQTKWEVWVQKGGTLSWARVD